LYKFPLTTAPARRQSHLEQFRDSIAVRVLHDEFVCIVHRGGIGDGGFVGFAGECVPYRCRIRGRTAYSKCGINFDGAAVSVSDREVNGQPLCWFSLCIHSAILTV